MKVEFFSAECKLCNSTLNILQDTFPDLQITVHRQSECVDGSCCQLAASYGVRAVPSLVMDGRVVLVGRPDSAELELLANVLKPYP
ncbi:MAG: thioredoxin family protein [Chloroflexi bacterium]|nr:thioredoxin family protein [Chloroflexota bacterium]